MTAKRVPRADRSHPTVRCAAVGWLARWSYHHDYYGWCDATTWRPTGPWARRTAQRRVTRRARPAWTDVG